MIKKTNKNKPDWIFMCRKCRKCCHEVYRDKTKGIEKFITLECPECGEEAYQNWIFIGEGDFKKL